MLGKLLSKPGRRLLKAVKKLSTRIRRSKKQHELASCLSPPPADLETASLSWSLSSLDTTSIDTYMTYLADNLEDCSSGCCYCRECEDNERNESIEREMAS